MLKKEVVYEFELIKQAGEVSMMDYGAVMKQAVALGYCYLVGTTHAQYAYLIENYEMLMEKYSIPDLIENDENLKKQ